MNILNVTYVDADIYASVGEVLDLIIAVEKNDVEYDLTGATMVMVIKRKDGTVVRTLTTAGDTPALTIQGTSFRILTAAFTKPQTLDHTITLTPIGGTAEIIARGKLFIE